MKVLICSNPVNLKAADPHVTVEAEYGDMVVEGSVATFAHHGPRKDNPPPCINPRTQAHLSHLRQIETAGGDGVVVGLSHFDLDALGGVMKILGPYGEDTQGIMGEFWKPFWELAAFVDVNGPHKADRKHKAFSRLAAFWAWSGNNRVYPPRDGGVLDITEAFSKATKTVCYIIGGDANLLDAGIEFMVKEDALNKDSFLGIENEVITRDAPTFTNHLYGHPWDGSVAKAVVALNTKQKSVTVSLESPIDGISAKDVVQALWGEEAGGHDRIAGSPRNQEMTKADLHDAAKAMVEVLKS